MKRLLPDTPYGWLLLIAIIALAAGGIADGIDWNDRRSCRVDGGQVERIEDGRDWRCVRGAP